MAWIEFNGIRSDSVGCIVERFPGTTKPGTRYTANTVPGHFGNIYISDTREGFTADYTLNCFGRCEPKDIYRWLDGEGWLVTSDAPELKRYVRFFESVVSSRARNGRCFDSVTMKAICDPFQILQDETQINVDGSAVFNGLGDMVTEPLIAVTGNGGAASVFVNDTTMLFDDLDGVVYIDCESKQAYTVGDAGELHMFSDVVIANNADFDRWAKLKPTTNTVLVINCTAELTPRWRFF